MSDFKKLISNIVLAGAVAALIAFGASLFLPKKWQVSGKVVVFPSGKPVSASQNLAEEVGNTAWIVNSDTFQKNNFGDLGADFAGAEVVKNSSMVLVKFRSSESDIQLVEDLIVKIPNQVDEYARDLYDGSPFKYKMSSDPEISARPVRPNVVANSTWGFAIGALLYILYWLMISDYIFKSSKSEEISIEPQRKSVFDFFPEMEEEKKVFGEKVEFEKPMIKEEPKTISEKVEKEPETKRVEKTFSAPAKSGPAPMNLPIAEPETPNAPVISEYNEPSDEEVKDRLNRLMRGEL